MILMSQAAYEYVSGGYDDWYLPSNGNDLYLMKTVLGENNNNIGQFVEGWYWTSTHGTNRHKLEGHEHDLWPFSFSEDGHLSTKNNPIWYYVRPIRTFKNEKPNLHINLYPKPPFLSRDKEHGTCWGEEYYNRSY